MSLKNLPKLGFWFEKNIPSGNPVSDLQLSGELAPLDIGYRRMTTYSVRANRNDATTGSSKPPETLPPWIDAKGADRENRSRSYQGCQIVYFQTKKRNLGKFR
jgi:hypothetical protein